jgi:hypothetical protein
LYFVLIVFSTNAATYYVDATNGNDSNSGLSITNPWKTIAKVNNSKFLPGDNILFKRGEVWREGLLVPSSGSIDKPIIFNSYGYGKIPVIDASNFKTNWIRDKNNIWKTELDNKPNQVFFDNDRGNEKNNYFELRFNNEWFYENGLLYIFTTLENNKKLENYIKISKRDWCIYIDRKEYINILNVELENANNQCVLIRESNYILLDSLQINNAFNKGIDQWNPLY